MSSAWEGLMDDVVNLMVARLDRYRVRDVAIMVFFLGKLGYQCSGGSSSSSSRMRSEVLRVGLEKRMWEFEGNALALLIWGLGRMGFWAGGGSSSSSGSSSFLSTFTSAAARRLTELRPPQMVMMMEGLTRVGYNPSADEGVFLLLFLAQATTNEMTDFSKDNLSY